jgi:DHA1 family tetracycline resistance protein-like MFS transporter
MTEASLSAPVLASPKRSALTFIFITVVLDMLALGIIVPVLPKLVVQFLSGDTARGAEIYGLFGTVWALMHFLFSPVTGLLSDRFGRRPVILLSNFGLGLDYVLMAVAPTLSWLFVGRVVSGITAASVPAASAYIADVTPPEKRAAAFGMIGAAFGIGFVVGPALGGLLGGIGPRVPFVAAAVLSLLNAGYGLFVLPESLPPSQRSAFEWKKANPVGSLTLMKSSPELFRLAAVRFLGSLAHVVLPSTFVLYASYRYSWDARMIGLCLAMVGVCSGIVQGALIGPAVRRLGEHRTLVVGMLFGFLGFAAYGLAPTGAWFWVGLPLTALWGLANPALQTLMTRLVSGQEQGQLQGANSSIMGIAELLGPGIFTLSFASCIRPEHAIRLPGAPFLLAALILLSGAALAGRSHSTART